MGKVVRNLPTDWARGVWIQARECRPEHRAGYPKYTDWVQRPLGSVRLNLGMHFGGEFVEEQREEPNKECGLLVRCTGLGEGLDAMMR